MARPCRLCLALYSKAKLHNVFTCNIKNCEDSLVDVLFWVYSVEIDVTDPYAKDICNYCLRVIEYFVEVKNGYQTNQEILRKNEQCNELGSGSLRSAKKPKHDQKDREIHSTKPDTPTSNPTKRSCDESSPRVQVSLSTLDSMCPLTLKVERLETSSEYMQYKQIGNGRFKKRKYRHFSFDDCLLNDICSMFDDKNGDQNFKRNVAENNDLTKEPKAINHDNSNMSIPFQSSLNFGNVETHLPAVINSKRVKDEYGNDNSMHSKRSSTKASSLSSPKVDKNCDRTRVTVKNDTTMHTEPRRNRSIGTNTQIDMVEVGEPMKRLRQTKNKNEVKISIQSLNTFSPKVWIEPVEYLMDRENYKEIDKFCYKRDDGQSEEEQEHQSEESRQDHTENKHVSQEVKKQRFLDYYKTFSSLAIRELIAGKNIRESNSETSSVFKVSNICHVYVCDFCSESFLSQLCLNFHYKQAHKQISVPSITDKDGVHPKNSVHNKCNKKITPSQGKLDHNELIIKPKEPNSTKTLPEDSNDVTRNISLDFTRKTESRTRERRMTSKTINVTTGAESIHHRKRRRNRAVSENNAAETTYIWDRKCFGTYSAITFHRKEITKDTKQLCEKGNKKQSPGLSETIQKLADRLDECENLDNREPNPT